MLLPCLLVLQALQTHPAAIDAQECGIFARSAVECRTTDWKKWPDAEIDAVQAHGDLGNLLEGLLEGRAHAEWNARMDAVTTPEEGRALLDSMPPPDDCLLRSRWAQGAGCATETCLEAELERLGMSCAVTLVQALSRVAIGSPSRAVRLGAVALAFGIHVDEPPDPEDAPAVHAALTEVALALLSPEHDTVTHAAVLKMCKFHALNSLELTDRTAALMSSPSELVQYFAINEFFDRTSCPLMEKWSREALPTPAQVKEAQAWWTRQRPTPAADD